MAQAKVGKTADILDFSEMNARKDDFIKNILQRQIDLAETFAKFAWSINNGKDIFNVQKDIITDFVKNLNIEQIKERLVEKKTDNKIVQIILQEHFWFEFICVNIVVVNFIVNFVFWS